jgi:5-(hydroxymethyl)furfural/furfural oxidase
MIWDYVIVGGGTAGCILANRLSVRSSNRVLLLEAGHDTPPGAVPAELLDSYSFRSAFDPAYQWADMRVHIQPIPHNRGAVPATKHYEQARVLGGGSSINGQQANRGTPDDYDAWASQGAEGWAWSDVLPWFIKLESDRDYDGPLHGRDGPIPITRVPQAKWPGFAQAAARAFSARGWSDIGDQNGRFDDGWFPMSLSNDGTHRVSAPTAYLSSDVRARPNLEIRTGVTVDRLLHDARRITGVALANGEEIAGREVVVCAGALRTPDLLLRAGIGPGSDLRALGLDVVADRSGVGRNLQDHPTISVSAYLKSDARLYSSTRRHIQMGLRYSSGVPGGLPADMYMVVVAKSAWHAIGRRLGSLVGWVNKPYSRGQVRLQRDDGVLRREVAMELLSDERDLRRLMASVRLMAELFGMAELAAVSRDPFASTFGALARAVRQENLLNRLITIGPALVLDSPAPARRALIRHVLAPGRSLAELLDHEALLAEHVRRYVSGGWHPSGTCKMGAEDDASAVVDPRTARVHGVDGLSVVDASLMPSVPRANTNLPTMMIAEKMAESILSRPEGLS